MDFLMFVPFDEDTLASMYELEVEFTDWYTNLEDLQKEHGKDSEYSIVIYEDFKDIYPN